MNKKLLLLGILSLNLISASLAESDITYYGLPDGYNKINSINFSDVLDQGQNYWAKPAIYQIASLGIMSGFSTSSFSPITSVTNEQAITTILNATGKASNVEEIKMLVNNWSDKYIKYAMNNGLITEKIVYKKDDVKGDMEALKSKGVFIRDIPITREEMASLIYRAFNLPLTSSDDTKKPVDFLDKALIDESRVSHVDAVSMAGIMVGNEDKMFNPKSGLTRAELAQILRNSEDYLLNDLRLIKQKGYIDSASATGVELTDDEGNTIYINCSNLDIPVVRNNTLSGVYALRSADEVEFFINTSKQVVFIRVIDEGIYQDNSSDTSPKLVSKQGIVVGNSPYFYEISIKDKNGNVESYKYGSWTDVYKDGKDSNATDIFQGDTVYLEFDEIGDLVVIRGVTNTIITYGTITRIDGNEVSIKMNATGEDKNYNLRRIPVYKNGIEIDIDELYNGEYAKLYSSQSEIIKVEIVQDDRTAENLYKGYISEINLIQDRIILRNPYVFGNGEWNLAESSFITIPLDNDMKIIYDDEEIEKEDLGEKQVGKFAYIVTREDTKLLEKIKSINIGFESDDETVIGEVRSYNEDSGLLKLYDDSRKFYIDDTTICVIDGKITPNSLIGKGDNVSLSAIYDDGRNIVKLITDVEKEEKKTVEVYYGTINNIEKSDEVSIKITGIYEDDEWSTPTRSYASFEITPNTRIYTEQEPLNLKEFDFSSYKDREACIIAYGDEAISIGIMNLSDAPYISVGSIKSVGTTDFVIQDVEYYDYDEEEWQEGEDETITTVINTLITLNGNFARFTDIKKDFEVVVIRKDSTSSAGVVLLTD